jgi:anti-sigma regulatory factor (Ser/Thr protein kinase)
MDNKPFTSYEIAERSFVSFVKREIHQKAVQADFNPSRVGTIDIIVSELTSNIIKHAGHGELLYRFSDRDDCKQFEIICIDGGEGIKDIAHSMKDGVSTTKTLGQGLGAMERMSDVFQVYSIVKWGTVCYSKVYAEADKDFSSADSSPVKCKALNVSKPGQTVSGDGYDIIFNPGHTKIFMGTDWDMERKRTMPYSSRSVVSDFPLQTIRHPYSGTSTTLSRNRAGWWAQLPWLTTG